MAGNSQRDRLDLAVIGGGVAGAYVAYQMGIRRSDWSIGLFEQTDRIGGRLLSLRFPGVRSVPAELGGMRFRRSQPLVSGLVQELGLETRPFLTVHDDNRFFLRGARWRFGEPEGASMAYRLEESERGLSPGELLISAFDRVVPGASALSDEDWLVVKREHAFLGHPLREWSLGDVLERVLSREGYRYVVDGFGYATILGERNAADAIPWVLIEARPESENTTLVDGMERLPHELSTRFVATGGSVRLQHRLLGFDRAPVGTDSFRLDFDARSSVTARHVVLAVPHQALEDVRLRAPLLAGSEISSLIGSVTGHPAAKLALAYERPWWREIGIAGMRAVSDLWLSKTYYFDWRGAPADEAPALLLASYSDGPSREAWCSLRQGSGFPDDPEPFDSKRRWERYAASPDQIAEAQRQLRELHDVREIPEPVASAFVDWGAYPFGAAWHVWNAGVLSWDVMARIVQPLHGVDLFICGEPYSWSQGWVEGALESAQTVVDRLTA
jgi:monoamine oxidase